MTKSSLVIVTTGLALGLAASLTLAPRAAAAQPIIIETPAIFDGDSFTSELFFGRISIGAETNDPAFGGGSLAEYSLDNGATYHPATVENGSSVRIVNTTTSREQLSASVAALAGGGYVVTWASFGNDGSDYGVFARRYDAEGEPASGELQVNTFTALAQSQPQIAALGGGGFAITWTSSGQDGSGFGVFAQRFDASGARLGGEFRVNDFTARDQFRPAIAGLGDGGFIITWQSIDQLGVGSGNHIFAKRYDAAGALVAPPGGCQAGICDLFVDVPSSTPRFGPQTDPSVAATSNGGFVISWTGEGSATGRDDEVYGKLYAADYSVIQNSFLLRALGPDATLHQRTSAVAPWGDGGFAAVWVTFSSTTGTDVYLQAFTGLGVPVLGNGTSDLRVNASLAGNQNAPAIASLSDGGLLVTWSDAAQSTRVIAAQRFNAALATVGGELSVAPATEGSGNFPVAVGLPNGAMLVAWEASGNSADTANTGVFSRRLSKAHLVKRDLTPTGDIDIRFRLTEASTPPRVWTSPVRRYRYADPNAGSDGAVIYPHALTRAAFATIGLVLPDIPIGFQHIQLYQRSAPLLAGQCGDYEAWQPIGQQSTLVRAVDVVLADLTCHQWKWQAVNGLGTSFEYVSANVLAVDRVAPTVVTSHQQVGNLLRVTVGISELGSGVAASVYVANRGQPVPFSSGEVLIPLRDGANSIRIEITDGAGNVGSAAFFYTAELRPASITIHSLEEGQTYGGDLALVYSVSRPLADLTVFLDGAVTDATDLSALPDGPHHLLITGRDALAGVISAEVHFFVERAYFAVSLLSPQARTYPESSLTVTYAATGAVASTRIFLDGAPQPDAVLRDLSDGDHTVTLEVTAADGALRTLTRTFRVEEAAPSLVVTSPVEGQALTSRSVRLELEANCVVEYRVGELHGPAVPGALITLPADGPQQLTLTATHPSGASVTRTINLRVDSEAPTLELRSPVPRLYAARAIPIDFRSNKTLRDVTLRLDGAEVTALDDVADGAHQLEVTGKDEAGRLARATVDFAVAHLEILSPVEGEKVLDNNVPPVVTLQWDAGGTFTSLTAAVDRGEEQLLPAGSSAPLQLSGGAHEIVVRGKLGDQVLARSVRFFAGARNLRVNQNSIKYAFTGCDDELTCDVTVTLQVENVGDYEIAGPVPIVFEVLSAGGEARSFAWSVDAVAPGERRRATLTPFRARLEDRFRITVDPERTIAGEDPRDNGFELVFQPGKILQVESALSRDNYYVSRARTDNLFAVATAGPVAYVEFQAGDIHFRDTSGEQGFASPVDMGLLDPQQNYVVIRAFGADNQLLDARVEYFDVIGMHADYPVSNRASPWRFFLGAGNRVFVDEIDQRALARAELRAMTEALGEDAITLYRMDTALDADGRQRVSYGMTMSDAPSLRRSGGAAPLGAGGFATANAASNAAPSALGQGTRAVGAMTRLSLGDGACSITGFQAITSSEDHRQRIVDGLDAMAAAAQLLIDTELEPRLETTIKDAFDRLQSQLAPFTDGFGLGVILPGFFAFVVGDLDIVPPSVRNIRFSFVGELEDFALDAGVTRCEVRRVGAQLLLDTRVDFEMRFRRRFALSADVSGGGSGFVFAGLGLPIPGFNFFGLVHARVQLMSPSFTGALTLKLHYAGGLRGRLLTPALVLDQSDTFLGVRVPQQAQRVAEAEVYAFAWVPFLGLFSSHVEVDAFAELQAETVLESHLAAPIVLANPSYGAGILPDTDSFLSPSGHIFSKARSLIIVNISVCYFFICVPLDTIFKNIELNDTCLKVSGLELVDGTPGQDCPQSVPTDAFPSAALR